mgnify:CR=1 FL=1
MKTKLVISAAVAYITVPSDLIPDKVPFVGKIDDIAIGIFALNCYNDRCTLKYNNGKFGKGRVIY